LQRLRSSGRHAEAIVDFAHTPEALQQALSAVRQHTRGRLWCVFGCGGDRDAGKRAAMGEVAASLADQVVLTDDNPRSEDPEAIAADVLAGMPDATRVARIADRGAAIQYALRAAANDDAVLIAGKGHETQQWLADGAVDFSDVAVARAALSGAP
jgi:UDP-N-acetylmuramoyl-L-alanyl-D-glutamate--2,6-diaminopimelate ligase